ncbi:uncharacterized protein TM35_000102900, partial [Trypanosoma theileri]
LFLTSRISTRTFLGNAGHLNVVPRSSTSYCRGKPRASDVFLVEDPLALRLRRCTAPGPAASCWGRNISKKVLGQKYIQEGPGARVDVLSAVSSAPDYC